MANLTASSVLSVSDVVAQAATADQLSACLLSADDVSGLCLAGEPDVVAAANFQITLAAPHYIAGGGSFPHSVKMGIARETMIRDLITSYPIRDEWREVSTELLNAWRERVKMWESVGAYEGLIVKESCVLPLDLVESLPSIREASKWFSLSMSRDVREKLGLRGSGAAGGSWRLSFRPGAIIGASVRDGNTYSSIACFGYDGGYEGTAGQMVFDPHIAVLEYLDENGERATGFQMVALSPTGIHAYGGTYTGYSNDSSRASGVAYALALAVRGGGGCSYAKENNQALNALADILAASSGTYLNVSALSADEKLGPIPPDSLLIRRDCPCLLSMSRNFDLWPRVDLQGWRPLDDVNDAYCETVYAGGFFDSGVTFDARKRLYNSSDVDGLLSRVGIGRAIWGSCEWCEADITEDQAEDGDYWCGDEYGLGDTYYCCSGCLRDAMEDAADQRLDNVVLIDGDLYRLP